MCDAYAQAEERESQGIHTLSTDEMTGIQALERKHPTKPMRPGTVERREFEYIRHGTQTLINNLNVGTGKIVSPSIGSTRTEDDYLEHIKRTVSTDPEAAGWIIINDQLNTHQSESLVLLVAEYEGLDIDLGKKGKSGILKSLKTRKAFLEDPSHKLRFIFTPKHCSWLNQVEIFFGILVRKVIKRGNFLSQEDLKHKILTFLDYYNETMAKVWCWTYRGRPLII